LASDLVDERGLQTFSEHVGRFTQERQTRAPTSLANTSGVGGDPRLPGCIYWIPVVILIGVSP